jgi:hypothetical protein
MQNDKKKERHGKEDVEIPSSTPREDKHSNTGPVQGAEERRQKPHLDNTPETGPGGE